MYWEDELTVGGVKRFFGFEYRSMYDEDGTSIGCFFRIEDKTEDMKRLRDEKYRATHDRLTGVYNRESFFDEAESFIREHAGESMYMLASNIKDFKLVNELFGDDKGDEILEKEAELLKEKEQEILFWGGLQGIDLYRLCLKGF